MNQNIIHHHYHYGSTFDTSTYGNHGEQNLADPGTGLFDSALHFTHPDSRVTVLPSESTENIYALATMVRFYLEDATLAQRYNLIEGHASFALYVESGGALVGTILDSNGNWTGASTPITTILPNTWHEAWLIHDGVSQLELQLDHRVVARAYDVPGPVRSVDSLGVAIGNWPDAGAYPFVGYIDEVKVYKYDPVKDAKQLLDPCCFNGRAIDEIVRELAQKGSLTQMTALPNQLLALIARINALLRTTDAKETRRVIQMSHMAYRALQTRNESALSRYHREFEQLLANSPNVEQIRALQQQVVEIIQTAGLDEPILRRLTNALCFHWSEVDKKNN